MNALKYLIMYDNISKCIDFYNAKKTEHEVLEIIVDSNEVKRNIKIGLKNMSSNSEDFQNFQFDANYDYYIFPRLGNKYNKEFITHDHRIIPLINGKCKYVNVSSKGDTFQINDMEYDFVLKIKQIIKSDK